jgi:hypothetical protein
VIVSQGDLLKGWVTDADMYGKSVQERNLVGDENKGKGCASMTRFELSSQGNNREKGERRA